MNSDNFRKELVKIMPGYNWTVHRNHFDSTYLSATGIRTAGFNRLSTLQITRRETSWVEYEAKSAGYGVKAPWVSSYAAPTLAQALRGLQNHYESMASLYSGCAAHLQGARKKRIVPETTPSTGTSDDRSERSGSE